MTSSVYETRKLVKQTLEHYFPPVPFAPVVTRYVELRNADMVRAGVVGTVRAIGKAVDDQGGLSWQIQDVKKYKDKTLFVIGVHGNDEPV